MICKGSNQKVTSKERCILCGSNAGNIAGKAFPHSVPKVRKTLIVKDVGENKKN